MKHFFTATKFGLSKRGIFETFSENQRTFVLHQNEHGFFAVSDYVTGFQVCENVNKEDTIFSAKAKINRNIEFDYSVYPIINSPKNLQLLKELEELAISIMSTGKAVDSDLDTEITVKFTEDDFSG